MSCDELRRLLGIYSRDADQDIANELIATHIRSCPTCQRGIKLLSKMLISNDTLTCEQCRARLPSYYEATHPGYPLVQLSSKEMAEVALHLGNCPACREQYEALVLLSELEERDEIVDE